jgi:HK97 gp10 family phage protein
MPYESKIPAKLREAERKVREANRRAAGNVAERAAAEVPRDTGRTARSVKAVPTNDGYEVHVDFPGHLLEFGSVKMPARPFLTPAAEFEREAHQRAVREAYT